MYLLTLVRISTVVGTYYSIGWPNAVSWQYEEKMKECLEGWGLIDRQLAGERFCRPECAWREKKTLTPCKILWYGVRGFCMLLHSLLSILYSRLSSSLSYQSLQHLTEQCVFLFVTSCKWKTGSFYKQPARQHRKSSSHSRLITLHNIYLTMLIMITCCFWATMGDVYDPLTPFFHQKHHFYATI